MNAKTLEAITRHGLSLLAAFPDATETDPVALCRKLRRVEHSISEWTLTNCNVGVPEDVMDTECDKAQARVKKLLGLTPEKAQEIGLRVNRDPRGYALKLSDDWTRGYNETAALRLDTDWGGYGILAPDLTA
jgi:hypothetical protein